MVPCQILQLCVLVALFPITSHGFAFLVNRIGFFADTAGSLSFSLSRQFARKVADELESTRPQQQTNSFDELSLCQEAMSAIRSQPDWIVPTPIQQLVIPKLLIDNESSDDGYKDDGAQHKTSPSVWCEAPTGSGTSIHFRFA